MERDDSDSPAWPTRCHRTALVYDRPSARQCARGLHGGTLRRRPRDHMGRYRLRGRSHGIAAADTQILALPTRRGAEGGAADQVAVHLDIWGEFAAIGAKIVWRAGARERQAAARYLRER